MIQIICGLQRQTQKHSILWTESSVDTKSLFTFSVSQRHTGLHSESREVQRIAHHLTLLFGIPEKKDQSTD